MTLTEEFFTLFPLRRTRRVSGIGREIRLNTIRLVSAALLVDRRLLTNADGSQRIRAFLSFAVVDSTVNWHTRARGRW